MAPGEGLSYCYTAKFLQKCDRLGFEIIGGVPPPHLHPWAHEKMSKALRKTAAPVASVGIYEFPIFNAVYVIYAGMMSSSQSRTVTQRDALIWSAYDRIRMTSS